MKRSAAPTLEDVARKAGVSVMVASIVLNGARSSARASEATRLRVIEAAAQLGYRRNALARGLARQIVDTIGVTAIIDRQGINLYFHEVLNGILAAAADHHQNTTIFALTDWKEEERVLQFCDGRVDGMILIAPLLTSAFIQTLPSHTPFLTIHSNYALPGTYNLDVDNEGGGYEITRYLIAQGHRRIAHISGGTGLYGAEQRLAGYRRALLEADIPYDETLVIPGSFSTYSGKACMDALLSEKHLRPLPTAIFCASDAIAYGCMESLSVHRVRVPEDISIVGFDDTPTAQMTFPPLTTVRQPFREMGRRAVEHMLQQIRVDANPMSREGIQPASVIPGGQGSLTEIFSVSLVERASVMPPNA